MSYISEEELRNFLGKQLNDEYGRVLGRVIGLRINDYGQLQALEIERGNGDLAHYPLDLVTIDRGSLFVVSDWKVSSESVLKELDRAERRIRALGELLQEHQIPANIYGELKKKQEETLQELTRRRRELLQGLHSRGEDLDKQVDTLIRFLVNVKMEFRAGLIDEAALNIACDAIEPNLKPIIQEKKDVSSAMDAMSGGRAAPHAETAVVADQSPQGTSLPVAPQEQAKKPIPIQLEG